MSPRTLLAFLPACLLAACAQAPQSPEDARAQALRQRNPDLELERAGPDARPAPFDRVALAPIELEFRPVAALAGPSSSWQNRTEFPVGERERAALAETFDEIFRDELGDNGRIALTAEPGPGVLVIKPALRDIVSRVPPEEPPGRSDVLLDSVGDATLVVEFADGGSGTALGTATDRRTAEPAGALGDFGAVQANKVGTGQEVRRLARRWAMSLERRVEQLYFEAKPR
jgi:hypothetical protein